MLLNHLLYLIFCYKIMTGCGQKLIFTSACILVSYCSMFCEIPAGRSIGVVQLVACSLQDSYCDQNATQHINSDYNLQCKRASNRMLFLVYLWRAQLGILMYRKPARFNLNMLLLLQVVQRNMFSLCVYK